MLMPPSVRLAAVLVVSLALGLGTAACGADAAPSGGGAGVVGTGTGSDPIEISIEGDSVSPGGVRVDAAVGEPLTLQVTSDRAGALHVHSSPEQELAYDEGETTLTVTVDAAGVVDVEDHVAEVVVLQLEVS